MTGRMAASIISVIVHVANVEKCLLTAAASAAGTDGTALSGGNRASRPADGRAPRQPPRVSDEDMRRAARTTAAPSGNKDLRTSCDMNALM